MDLKKIIDFLNKRISDKYDDFDKYSNLVIDHSILNGKIKKISLDFMSKDKKIEYKGYEMVNSGVLVVNIDLNTDMSYDIDDDYSDFYGLENFIGFDLWQLINNIIFPYINKKYFRLIGIRLSDMPFIDFVFRNSKGQTLFYHEEDMEDFDFLSKTPNPMIWKKVD